MSYRCGGIDGWGDITIGTNQLTIYIQYPKDKRKIKNKKEIYSYLIRIVIKIREIVESYTHFHNASKA